MTHPIPTYSGERVYHLGGTRSMPRKPMQNNR